MILLIITEKTMHTRKPKSVMFSYPRLVNRWALENKNPDKAVFEHFGHSKCSSGRMFLHSILWP